MLIETFKNMDIAHYIILITVFRSDRLAFALSTYLPGNGRSLIIFVNIFAEEYGDGDGDGDGDGSICARAGVERVGHFLRFWFPGRLRSEHLIVLTPG